MKILTDFAYLIALIIVSPKIIYRMLTQDRYKKGWAQRLGNVNPRDPQKKCIWIHAVSVGEVNATRTLVTQLQKALPEYEIVISATTDTGFKRATDIYAQKHSVFYFPFDFSPIMKRAFQNLKPRAVLLMELEIWPNLAQIARKHKTKIVVLNGRISDKSFPRYKLIKPIIKNMFKKLDLCLVQTAQYAKRFKALGCQGEKIVVTNSLKYDTAKISDKIEGSEILANQLNIDPETDKILLAGGTGPGEEKIIIEIFEKLRENQNLTNLRLAIVPRKPERFEEVAELIKKTHRTFARYSKYKNTPKNFEYKPDIILGDTMGDLNKFYSLATVVFVGRSLVPMGGSDMMEPAALGKCTIFGPHTFNFNQTVKALLNGVGAIQISTPEELLEVVKKCLNNPEFAKAIAEKGQKVIIQNQGATQTTVKEIVSLLSPESA